MYYCYHNKHMSPNNPTIAMPGSPSCCWWDVATNDPGKYDLKEDRQDVR